jgi:phosphoribosylglycinamide formyltransferase-1
VTKRVVILISGGGSNMVSLAKDMTGDHPCRPVLVVSNVPNAGGLLKAADLGIATAVVDHKTFNKDRDAFEAELASVIEAANPDIICLAGFMRILGADFIRRFEGKMLNIHPSLLPKYKGLHTHQRAIEAGDTVAGCSVHEVTAELDGGPVLGQAKVAIAPDDTADALAERVLPFEHRLYPAILRRFAAGNRDLLLIE